jgi:phosphopantetheinyl transferase (holo-ACP synthase)
VFDAQERAASASARSALGIWAVKEAVLKAAGAARAELAQVRVRGRRVQFRGQRWYCRAPRLGERVVVRLATSQPVRSLRLQAVGLRQALAP